jgi:hypothetical protein
LPVAPLFQRFGRGGVVAMYVNDQRLGLAHGGVLRGLNFKPRLCSSGAAGQSPRTLYQLEQISITSPWI